MYSDSKFQEKVSSLPSFSVFGHDWFIVKSWNSILLRNCVLISHPSQTKAITSLLFHTRHSKDTIASARAPEGTSHLGLEMSSRPIVTSFMLVNNGSVWAGTSDWFLLGGSSPCSCKACILCLELTAKLRQGLMCVHGAHIFNNIEQEPHWDL